MPGILALDLVAARDALRTREITSAELTAAYLSRIEATADLNAFITVTADKAMAMAAASDERLAKGQGGALEGLPIAIKDLFCTEGVLTTAASRILDGFKPTYESTVTANLWRAGAVMLGKTNMDEFAMGSSSGTSYYGPAVNPWRGAQDARTPLVPGRARRAARPRRSPDGRARRHRYRRHGGSSPPARQPHRHHVGLERPAAGAARAGASWRFAVAWTRPAR